MQLKIWNKDIDSAIYKHYLYLVARTYLGWYQERNFLILPNLIKGMANSVVLPKTELLKSYNWQKAFKDIPKAPNYQDLPEFDFKKFKQLNITKLIDKKFDKNSLKKLDKPLRILEDILKNTFDIKSELKIYILPVTFGTKTSFFHLDKNTILIVKRADTNIVNVLDAIISETIANILKNSYENNLQSWRIREEIAEFFLYHSKISKYIDLKNHKKNEELLFSDKLQDFSYKIESGLYLKSLNFPIINNPKNVDWAQINQKLSLHEKLVAQTLYNNKNQIVKYDELAELLYQEDSCEKFSLQYFAKVVEQVRKKFKYAGINNNVIFTKRGVGYGWFD